MIEIIPAVLAYDIEDFRVKMAEIPRELSFAHIDVLTQDIWAQTDVEFEVHIMVSEPIMLMERWIERGAKRIIIHEINDEILKYRDRVELGLGLEMHAPVDFIEPFINRLDFLHLMSIAEIGEQGHHLDERIFDRIKMVKDKFPGRTVSVDGGIKIGNYKKLEDAGADRLIVGSGFKELWKSLMKEE